MQDKLNLLRKEHEHDKNRGMKKILHIPILVAFSIAEAILILDCPLKREE